MEGLCLVAVFLLFIFAWIYEKISGRSKGVNSAGTSTAAYKSLRVTTSKRGRCRYCGAEVIVDELPDSISRDAFEQFGACLNCQWGIYRSNRMQEAGRIYPAS
jgi:hypothetical protein